MIINDDCLAALKDIPDNSIDCVVTSPPYNLTSLRGKIKPGRTHTTQRIDIDYATYGDDLPEEDYQQWQIQLVNELYRVIKPTGSIFYNHKIRRWKGVLYHPWDFLSQTDAKLYQQITWNRSNSSNVRKEYLLPTTEHIYWFRKEKPKVFKSEVEHKTEVWNIRPERERNHPAPYPVELAENCILLTTQPGDIVLDPFFGSGTTGVAAKRLGRRFVGIELSKEYCELAERRLNE